ncbi:hypothetical protein LTR32_003686 [Rachicladosporium monterosium]|uniref:Haloacid dehalogenase, type II n=1 Tax=Rachicladosporium monterosium TaxID=1507873 RepID=A0ABR0L6T4_9PEZI|nr:hypothetical protein LTR32_003686 [Rachicladosporium monterosium]
MAFTTAANVPWTRIRALSFDIFGTLAASSPPPAPHPSAPIFPRTTSIVEEGKLTEKDVDEACKEYSGKIGTYPAFPDTVAAIQRLGKHYKLIPLTNVDNKSFAQTLSGPLKGCDFDAIYTAEDIGSYKPSLKNFHYLLDHLKQDFGIEKGDLCHVAQSLFHDHGPASEMQLMSVWVDRQGAMGGSVENAQERFGFQLRVTSLGELAEIVDAAFGKS